MKTRPLPRGSQQFETSLAETSSLFTDRLVAMAESASKQHAQVLLKDIFSRLAWIAGDPASPAQARERKRATKERQQHIAGLVRDLVRSIEQLVPARVGDLLGQQLRGRASKTQSQRREPAPRVAVAAERPSTPVLESKPKRQVVRRPPVRPAPPPPDPEQLKRDAEFARLRALLRPMPSTPQVIPPVAVPPPVSPQPQTPRSPIEFLRVLEQEMKDAVRDLVSIGPARCAARIAVWAGQARELRDRLNPEMLATTRPAFRIFFEHLQQLSEGFEAHVVDALEPTWTTGDWESYIEINRAIAQGRPAKVSTEKLHVYHRTLLRALTLPHRRRAGAEVAAILSAAVEVLPPEDPQLRTTLRRFASAWKGPAVNQPPAVSPSSPQPSHEKEVSQPAPAADAATNDFEEPWK